MATHHSVILSKIMQITETLKSALRHERTAQSMTNKQFSPAGKLLLAVFDIDVSSDELRSGNDLGPLVMQVMATELEKISDLEVGGYWTGTGAVVHLDESHALDTKAVGRFVDFVKQFTAECRTVGISLRTSINYSEKHAHALTTEHTALGSFVPPTEEVSDAVRNLQFCEVGEIIATPAVVSLLKTLSLEERYSFHHNDVVITNKGVSLDTYSLNPSDADAGVLYSATSQLHPYKRFRALPPIASETVRYFLENGLETELRKVLSNSYNAISHINESKTFLSSSEVLQVLVRTNYDPSDRVLVISRNDRPTGFWTQRRTQQYVTFLKRHASLAGGHINQERIWVFDDDTEDDLMPRRSMLNELSPLHGPKSLSSVPASSIHNYHHLSQLLFGVTISTKHRYAIIPAPSTDSLDFGRLRTERIGEMLWQHREYDDADGPMRAIITADASFVGKLITEFQQLVADPAATFLR